MCENELAISTIGAGEPTASTSKAVMSIYHFLRVFLTHHYVRGEKEKKWSVMFMSAFSTNVPLNAQRKNLGTRTGAGQATRHKSKLQLWNNPNNAAH